MRIQRKALLIVLTLICALCAAFAFGCSQSKTCYTVTFMDGQTQIGQPIQVEKGKRIEEYPVAEGSDPDDVFDCWYKDEALTKVWNVNTERVTKDITIWAGFLNVPATPSNAAMDDGAFSNTLVWLQRGITEDTEFTVKITGTDITSGGKEEFAFESYKGHNDIYTVKWTPAQKPVGGIHSAQITCDAESVTVEGLMFKGAGTSENPYLITSSTDLSAITSQDIANGNYYKLYQSFTARLSANAIVDKTFDGTFNGNGKTVTLEASDCGLFGTLGENAEVRNLTVAGAVANVQTNCAGVIAGVNKGKISKCTVSASVDSTVGSVGTLLGDKDGIEGGAAGVAGINYGEIVSCTYSGTIKASVGGAGIAVINNGKISLCSFAGTIGAANSNETGSSTKAYSYLGGIVSINYSLVEKSSTDGSGKLLAQRGDSGLNDYVGGIVALNQTGATVTECWFDGIRVHGNKNVGGIAGANAGNISYCYAGGGYHGGNVKCHSYVGGMSEVGGIVGLSQNGGSVSNCFVTSNVYAYSGNAYKVAQTSLNCVYLDGNLDGRDGIVSVTASEDNGNIKIQLSGDYSAKSYPLVLTDEQLTALNGENQLFANREDVCLSCENRVITVLINGNVVGEVSNVEGNKILLKEYLPAEVPANHYFAGWAVEQNGEAVFRDNAQINYSALEEYGEEQITLYPVFIAGEKPQSLVLNVAVYARYVNEDIIVDLLEEFKKSELFAGFEDVKYTLVGTNSSNNAAFQAGVADGNAHGDYNVAIGFRNSLDVGQSETIDLRILNKDKTALENRQVGLIGSDNIVNKFAEFLATDGAKRIMNPAYVSEAEADIIEITLMNGDTQYGEKLTVSNATDAKKVSLPVIDDADFKGWTVADSETLLSGNVGYDDLVNYAPDGKLTLNAKFKDADKTVLRIGYYTNSKNPVTADDLANIKSAFESQNENVTVEFQEFKYSNSNKFPAMVTTINTANSDDDPNNNIDCLINFPSSAILTDLTYKQSAQVGEYNKYIVQVTEGNEYSAIFFEFAKTDTTIAGLPQTA